VDNLSLLAVCRIDDDAAQRASLRRHMWLLSPKTEAQTLPHTVKADLCCVIVGVGGLHCWCLRIHFASATSMLLFKCCQPFVAYYTPFFSVPGQFCQKGSRIYLRTT